MGTLHEIIKQEPYIKTDKIAKIYPDFVKVITYNEPTLQRLPDLEGGEATTLTSKSETSEDSLSRSIRRTKTTISDLVLCNKFDMFATFTFKKDRQDVEKCKRKMSDWLHSQQKKHGKFKYLIVPEFHKDGKSIHFHALLKNYKGHLKKTNIKQKGRTIYNIKSYRSGFTTLVFIDDHKKVSSYIKKYITKSMPQFTNKQRYWCSTSLNRPEKILLPHQLQQITLNPFLSPKLIYQNNRYTITHYNVTIKTPTNIKDKLWQNQKPMLKNKSHLTLSAEMASTENGTLFEFPLQKA
jgi:hypothetical protein